MRILRVLILLLLALTPLATLVHRDDLGHWDLQRSAMAAPDEFSYLLMAQNFLHGGGLSLQHQLGQDTFYPPGYPLLLAACAKCVYGGILTAFTAHALNALLLCADVVIVYFLSRSLLLLLAAEDHRRFALSPAAAANFSLLITAAFTLNWHVFTLPLLVMSEPAFMLASFAWLTLALRWPQWHCEPKKAAIIALLAVVAWSMRAAGITCITATILFPMIAWWRSRRSPTPSAPPASRRLAALAIVLALPLLYQVVLHVNAPEKSLAGGDTSANSYTQQLTGGLADRNLPLTIFSHLEDFASSFVPELRDDPAAIFIRGIAGKCFLTLALIGWAAHTLAALRRKAPGKSPALNFMQLYLLFYIGLYLLWPFNAARFWTPILPIMLVYAACALLSFGSLLHKIPRLTLATAAISLLLLLHLEEDILELGIRARRLNYVSDSLDDSVRAILRQSPDPSTTIVAGMGADERFMMGWYFSQERAGQFPELHAGSRSQHADVMLLHLLDNQPPAKPRPIFFVSYFPVGQQGIDTRAALAAVAEKRPHAEITRIFQKEIIITVWRIDP